MRRREKLIVDNNKFTTYVNNLPPAIHPTCSKATACKEVWLRTTIRCPETSVRNYHYSLRNAPEEFSSQVLRDGSLKSREVWLIPTSVKNVRYFFFCYLFSESVSEY
jgi:hypothetical protein